MIDALPEPEDWVSTYTAEQWRYLHDMKVGQRLIFAKPESEAQPDWYIDQHKPTSIVTFNTFEKLVNNNSISSLTEGQIKSLSELLGPRTDKGRDTRAAVMHINERNVLHVSSSKLEEKTFSACVFVVANRKKRLIQEIGYEGAKKSGGHFTDEAEKMLMDIELKPTK